MPESQTLTSYSVNSILSQVEAWPVEQVAAGAIGPGSISLQHGPTSQIFKLASVTKPLVALAVLVAVEEGTLSLDQPAGPPGSTIKHLLAHASGLALDNNEILAPVGTRRIYSNTGYETLGAALYEHSGLPVAQYLHEAVLEPLGMANTVLGGSPAHGATSSVDDLMLLGNELLNPNGRILSDETIELATQVAFPNLAGVLPGYGAQTQNDWGLGFEIRDSKEPHWTPPQASPKTFGHFGRSGSVFWVDPVAEVCLVVLGNRDFGEWATPLWQDLGSKVLTTLTRG